MSWDIRIETGEKINFTHNVNPMIREAGFPDWSMGGIASMTAGQFADAMHGVFTVWGRDPETFRAMNPSNGWGSFDTLREAIAPFLVICRSNPSASLEASF